MDFLTELWTFLKVRKKYWLIPIIVMLGIFGGLLFFAQTAAGPLIYTLF